MRGGGLDGYEDSECTYELVPLPNGPGGVADLEVADRRTSKFAGNGQRLNDSPNLSDVQPLDDARVDEEC